MSELKERWRYLAPLPQGDIDAGQVILRDGTTAELRPVGAGDRELLAAFARRISDRARQNRFFSDLPPDSAAERLLEQGPPGQRTALIVLVGGTEGTRAIAHGEYSRDGEDSAEVAFLVDDRYQGRGLGTLLLERLALIAVRHGIRRFHGPTEPGNLRMREVFRQSGFPVTESQDSGEIEVSFSIEPSEASVRQAEMRERIATVASLQAFMKPRGIALVGASRNTRGIGYRILENLILGRFNGPVYPVNPHASVVGSISAYPSVAAVPGPVDLAVIAVPRDGVLGVVDECSAKGVRALLVISAGFAETGPAGAELQARLVAKARSYGMRLLGPNCLGLMNTAPDVRLDASFAPTFPPHGPVAMASQSGALGLAVLDYVRDLGIGLSSFASLGNKADVSGNDLIQYWEDDPDTGVILLYLESFGNPRRFARLARRVGRTKPIVVVKAGRSTAGGRAASSHTAALAASETATEALFRQAGIIRAQTLEEMFDTAALLAGQPLPEGPRVAVVTNAGGPGILAVDALEAAGLEVPAASPELESRLAALLPEAASTGNPVDMIASAPATAYRGVLEAVLADPGYDAALVLFTPVGLEEPASVSEAIHGAVAASRAQGIRKTVLACYLGRETAGIALPGERIPTYRFPEDAARALGKAYGHAVSKRRPLGRIPDFDDLDLPGARSIRDRVRVRGGGWLSAVEAQEFLAAFGVPLVEGRFAEDAASAVASADALGYPVVVKLASRSLIHKSEWGGVKVGLANGADVGAACREIVGRLENEGRLDELEGFLVQRSAAPGAELVVGTMQDPLFGPLVAFGLGGIHIEILRDVVFRITPLTDRDAHEMVTGIRGRKLLEGYRGAPAADTAALEELLLRVSRLVEEFPEVAELDLNPVRAFPPGEGALVLDARVRVTA